MKNQIKIPQGKKLVSVDLETGEYILEDIKLNIRERIKTLDDVFDLNNASKSEFEKNYKNLPTHVRGFALECLIANAYNEGRETVFNGEDYHYIAWWDLTEKEITLDYCGCYFSFAYCSALLFFNGEDAVINCEDAAKKFLDIYKLSR